MDRIAYKSVDFKNNYSNEQNNNLDIKKDSKLDQSNHDIDSNDESKN